MQDSRAQNHMDICTSILSDDEGKSLIHKEMDKILQEGYAKSKTYDYESEASNCEDVTSQGSTLKSKGGEAGSNKSSESKH